MLVTHMLALLGREHQHAMIPKHQHALHVMLPLLHDARYMQALLGGVSANISSRFRGVACALQWTNAQVGASQPLGRTQGTECRLCSNLIACC
jgi:hypothetical protein